MTPYSGFAGYLCRFAVRGSDGLVDGSTGSLGSTISVHLNTGEMPCGTSKVLLQGAFVCGLCPRSLGKVLRECLTNLGGLGLPDNVAGNSLSDTVFSYSGRETFFNWVF